MAAADLAACQSHLDFTQIQTAHGLRAKQVGPQGEAALAARKRSEPPLDFVDGSFECAVAFLRLSQHGERDCRSGHVAGGGFLLFEDGDGGGEGRTHRDDVMAADRGELKSLTRRCRQGRIGGEFGFECEAFAVVELGGGIVVHQHVGGSQGLVAGGDHEGVVLAECERAIQHRFSQCDLFLKGGLAVEGVRLLPHLQHAFPVEQQAAGGCPEDEVEKHRTVAVAKRNQIADGQEPGDDGVEGYHPPPVLPFGSRQGKEGGQKNQAGERIGGGTGGDHGDLVRA